MAAEQRRGCGHRKIGGLYLVSGGAGIPCCRLPLPLTVCPCCGSGIKQTRGWTWINPSLMFGESYKPECNACPAGNPAKMGERAGLLWVGERFYKTPADFNREANALGISRRISAIPRAFRAGETWVLLAHPKAVSVEVPAEGELMPRPEFRPGVFRIFKPERIELIVKQSHYDQAVYGNRLDEAARAGLTDEARKLTERFEADLKRGVTWVPVPDDDPDHCGSVYDDDAEEAHAQEAS